jgi:hypothetical protein
MGITTARSLRLATLALLAVSVHACSSDSATTPDTQPASLVAVLTEASLPAVETVGAVFVGGRFSMPPATAVAPSGCAYDASSQSFICPQTTSGGLTIDRAYTLYDDAGHPQAEFSSSTAAVQTKAHTTGTLTYVGGTTTLDYLDDRTVSGLRTAKHVLNGTSIARMDDSFSGGTSPPLVSSNTSTTKIHDLVLPSANNRWPGPGTLTSDNVTLLGAMPSMSSHFQADFNGTRCVVISFTMNGISETTVIDLSRSYATAGCTP